MKKIISIVVALIACFAMFSTTAFAAEAEPENLLEDVLAEFPTMDFGDYGGDWNRWHGTGDGKVGICEKERWDKTTGNVYFLTNDPPDTQGMSHTFEGLKPNTKYIFYFMLQTEGVNPDYPGCNANLHISYSDGVSDDAIALSPGSFGGTKKWSLKYVEFETGDTVMLPTIKFGLTATGGSAYFDCITLIEGTKDDIPEDMLPAPSSTITTKPPVDPDDEPDEISSTPRPPVNNASSSSVAPSSDVSNEGDANDGGLSTGAIIGIVAAAVVVLAGAAVAVYFLVIKKK